MRILQNTWVVAALHDEIVPDQLLARRYFGEPLVLFRDATGSPQALADRCPHRFAPLSMGRLCDGGNIVQCGYHGLQFNGRGECVHSPHGGTISIATRVKRHALSERAGIVWLWVGDAEQADESLVPDLSAVTSAPEHATIRGYLPTACDTQLLVDNILDLTHVDYLHLGSLGSGAMSGLRPTITEPDARSVRITWLSSGGPAPRGFDMNLRVPGQPTDQWTEVTWTAPSQMLLRVGATLLGEPPEAGVDTLNLHLATPECEGRTHYWYWSSRNFAISAEQNAFVKPMIENAFKNEDKPMLEGQQRNIGNVDLTTLKPVMLAGDAGSVRVRRKLQALIDAQNAMPARIAA